MARNVWHRFPGAGTAGHPRGGRELAERGGRASSDVRPDEPATDAPSPTSRQPSTRPKGDEPTPATPSTRPTRPRGGAGAAREEPPTAGEEPDASARRAEAASSGASVRRALARVADRVDAEAFWRALASDREDAVAPMLQNLLARGDAQAASALACAVVDLQIERPTVAVLQPRTAVRLVLWMHVLAGDAPENLTAALCLQRDLDRWKPVLERHRPATGPERQDERWAGAEELSRLPAEFPAALRAEMARAIFHEDPSRAREVFRRAVQRDAERASRARAMLRERTPGLAEAFAPLLEPARSRLDAWRERTRAGAEAVRRRLRRRLPGADVLVRGAGILAVAALLTWGAYALVSGSGGRPAEAGAEAAGSSEAVCRVVGGGAPLCERVRATNRHLGAGACTEAKRSLPGVRRALEQATRARAAAVLSRDEQRQLRREVEELEERLAKACGS